MQTDRFGNLLSTDSGIAAEHYGVALDRLFCMQGDARLHIDLALAEDPDFALAHTLNARVFLIEGNTKAAVQAATEGEQLALKLDQRQAAHAHLVARATRAENVGLLALVRDHAAIYPRDPLPLSLALGVYGLLGFGGFADHHAQQVELLETLHPYWCDDWWFSTWLGWSLVEAGRSQEGIPMLEHALAEKPNNATAAHGRAHGYYELGEIGAADRFLQQWLPTYGNEQPLHCHIAWHVAIGALQQGDIDQARHVYLTHLQPSVSKALPMFTMIDCTAFAWRAMLQGGALKPAELTEILTFTNQHFTKPGVPFVNLHVMLIHCLLGGDQIGQWLDQVKSAATKSSSESTEKLDVLASVVACDGVDAYQAGHYDLAAQRLILGLPKIAALGGSNAQRDGIIDTLVSALLRSGQIDAGREVLLSRTQLRASHLDTQWMSTLVR